jgi:hypothetical protein
VAFWVQGSATFMQLPKLARMLDSYACTEGDRVPPKTEFHLHVDKLLYIDHSWLDSLAIWTEQQEQKESTVTMQWDKLECSFHQPFT